MFVLPALVAALASADKPSALSLITNLDSQECLQCFQSSDHGRGLEDNNNGRRELNECYSPAANIGPLDHRGCYDSGASVGFLFGAVIVAVVLGFSMGIPLCCMCCAPQGCCGIGKLPRDGGMRTPDL